MTNLKEVGPSEVLILVGSCNDWNPSSAERNHLLVQKPGPRDGEVQHEVGLRVGVSNELEFQIISKRHRWDWRVFPTGTNKQLVRAQHRAVPAGIAWGLGAKDAHSRNFILREVSGSIVVVKVRLGKHTKVWYDWKPEGEEGQQALLPATPQLAAQADAAPQAAGLAESERLRLVGPFCNWKLEGAGLVFQRRFISHDSNWQEHRLYLQLHSDPIEFQVVSDQIGFGWRLFPKSKDCLALPKPGDATAGSPEVAVGGLDDGHLLNFVVDDKPMSVIAISVWLQIVGSNSRAEGGGVKVKTLKRSGEHFRVSVTYEHVGCSLQEAMQIALGCSPTAASPARAADAQPSPLPAMIANSIPDPEDPMEVLSNEGLTPEFWQQLCPWLHVGDKATLQAACPFANRDGPSAETAAALKKRLDSEGYFTVAKEELPWAVDVAGVARGVTTLAKQGLPAMCILVYDEPWVMSAQLRPLVRAVTGGNEPIFDWAAFCIQAGSRSGHAPSGWPPHRDRMSDRSAARGFRADSSPRYATVWVALTDASLESSCLMVVPKAHDPGYVEGDARSSPLDTVFCRPERYQHIRPLPMGAGGVVAFSHRLLHWGSAATPEAAAPRVAIAFGTADPAYEKPYLPLSMLPVPAFSIRLSLMAGQVITYSANEQVITTARRLRILFDIFEENVQKFSVDYRQTVIRFNAFKHEELHGATLRQEG